MLEWGPPFPDTLSLSARARLAGVARAAFVRWDRAWARAIQGNLHRDRLVTSASSYSKRKALAGSRLAALCAGMKVAMAIVSSKIREAATNAAAS